MEVDNDYEEQVKGLRQSAKNVNKENNRYLIYRCDTFCGGWGDRQKGFVFGYLLSLLTNRTFGILHLYPCSITKYLKPNYIQWDLDWDNIQKMSSQQFHHGVDDHSFRINLPNINFSEYYHANVVYYTVNQDYVEQIRLHPDTATFLPWLYTKDSHDVYRLVLSELFAFQPEFEKDIAALLPSNRERELACAHMRLGESFDRLPMHGVQRMWQFLNNYNDRYKYKIFVASDKQSIVNATRERFPKQFVDVIGSIGNIDRVGRDNCEVFRKTLQDLTILSKCDILILTTGSGLSLIAAYQRNLTTNLFGYCNNQIVPMTKGIMKLTGRTCWDK